MGNSYEIIGPVTVKLENAKVWYENAKSAYRYFAKSNQIDDLNVSSSYMIDMDRIGTYIAELKEIIHFITLINENINVIIFDDDTSEVFENTCKLHQEQGVLVKYTYLKFFRFGQNLSEGYLYIPPISTICEEKYQQYYPPSGDDGDQFYVI